MQASDSVDDFINEEIEAFVKQPWYVPSTKDPPPLPPLLESAFATIYHGIMDPNGQNSNQISLLIFSLLLNFQSLFNPQMLKFLSRTKVQESVFLTYKKVMIRWRVFCLMKQNIRRLVLMILHNNFNPKYQVGTPNTNLPSSNFLRTFLHGCSLLMFQLHT